LYNDAYASILEAKHPWALGQRGRDCWPEIWDIIGPMLEGVLCRGEATWSENQLLLLERNGYTEECYFTFSYSPIRDETGGIGGVFTAVTETTRQVLGERRLRTLRTLSATIAGTQTPEEVCQRAEEVLEANPADVPFALLYLLTPDGTQAHLAATTPILRRTQAAPPSLQLADENAPWPLEAVSRTGRPVLVENLAARLGEQARALLFTLVPAPQTALVLPITHTGEGRPAGFLIAGLSPRRPLDEEYRGFLRLVAEQVATALATVRAYQDAQARAEALAEIDRVKTAFFSNVSHEFRTPLTLSLGPLETLLSDTSLSLSDSQRELLRIVQRNSLRQLKLVNTLLDFSRLEAGRIEATYEAVDLAAFTTDLASTFRSAIEKAGMTLRVDCPPLDSPVYVDQQMWEKIVLNLLSNAFKYTFHGTITVRLRQKETTVELSVQDTGVGIPASELPLIFDRFHRVKGTEGRSYEGTGIGLSLVQELVRLHGGNVCVNSTPGQGSIFTISLPLGSSHLPPERIAAERTLPSTAVSTSTYGEEAMQVLVGQEDISVLLPDVLPLAEGRASSSPGISHKEKKLPAARILIADDNAAMRAYISRLLQPHYFIQTVADGKAALAAVKEQRPNLVLADVMMPRMDGFALLHSLYSNQATRNIPVILLSARAGEEAQIEGMAAGADDYLVKPFSARELLARVEARLEIARLRQEAEARVKAERQRLHDLFMQAPALIAVFRGPDHVFELANPLYMQTVGPQRNILGKPIRKALPELEGQGFFELLDVVYQTGQPFFGNEALVHLDRKDDGTLEDVYFNFVYQPSYNVSGDVDGVLVYANEVTKIATERKRAEESEERFRTIAENMSQLAWMADERGWIFWYNQRWYDYTGTTLQQMEGWGWQKVHHPDHMQRVVEKLRHCFATGEVWEDTFPLRGKNGSYRWFLSRAIPIRNEQGQVMRWFGTHTDITEQKHLEQQKDDFLGVASHELKTPITSIKAFAQLLERRFRQSGDTRSAALLQKMDAQLNKLTSLVEDLLDVTKIENGQLLFHFSSFEYNKLINEVGEETQRTAIRHIIVQDLAASVSLHADRERIGQVLTNLLTNAIKYSPQAEIVLVKTTCSADAIITSVQDFGIGIPKEKLPHLFEHFYRVEGDSQTTYPGLGLGLYISAECIKRHHGSIWVESEEGQGTTVSFSLPLHQTAEELATG
jgi:PAS domain S-box-containing protein